jgi:hypothetical protein
MFGWVTIAIGGERAGAAPRARTINLDIQPSAQKIVVPQRLHHRTVGYPSSLMQSHCGATISACDGWISKRVAVSTMLSHCATTLPNSDGWISNVGADSHT